MKKITFPLCLAAFLVFGGPAAFAQKGKPLFPQAPGMEAYTYRHSFKKDVAATLDSIKALGITELESGPSPNGLTPEAFRRLLDERGMTCPSIGVGYEALDTPPEHVYPGRCPKSRCGLQPGREGAAGKGHYLLLPHPWV